MSKSIRVKCFITTDGEGCVCKTGECICNIDCHPSIAYPAPVARAMESAIRAQKAYWRNTGNGVMQAGDKSVQALARLEREMKKAKKG